VFGQPASAVAKGQAIIQEALSQADNAHHSAVTCTAGTFILVFALSLVCSNEQLCHIG